ncbi:MAG: ribonuclease III [Nitrospiraceae bacterium]|nr:ribonuclease III [Nitrospiraceae bacterium]
MSKQDIKEFEEILKYSFKEKSFLEEALTHSSYFHENPENAVSYNERLEFLGDSVLGLVVVEYLFSLESACSESIMSKIKSYIVKESILYEVAVDISLGKYLKLGKGERETGGAHKKSILADGIEAVFGAVYLDGGYERAKDVILKLLKGKIAHVISKEHFLDFKTELQEKVQTRHALLPEYRVVKQEGKEHQKIFTVEVFIKGRKSGTGKGKSKKEAETMAAKEALARLLKH